MSEASEGAGVDLEARSPVADLANIARRRGLLVATAESLTSGNLAACLGQAPCAADWYMGGVVAYNAAVKHSLLNVPAGSVVTEEAARAMARSTADIWARTSPSR